MPPDSTVTSFVEPDVTAGSENITLSNPSSLNMFASVPKLANSKENVNDSGRTISTSGSISPYSSQHSHELIPDAPKDCASDQNMSKANSSQSTCGQNISSSNATMPLEQLFHMSNLTQNSDPKSSASINAEMSNLQSSVNINDDQNMIDKTGHQSVESVTQPISSNDSHHSKHDQSNENQSDQNISKSVSASSTSAPSNPSFNGNNSNTGLLDVQSQEESFHLEDNEVMNSSAANSDNVRESLKSRSV